MHKLSSSHNQEREADSFSSLSSSNGFLQLLPRFITPPFLHHGFGRLGVRKTKECNCARIRVRVREWAWVAGEKKRGRGREILIWMTDRPLGEEGKGGRGKEGETRFCASFLPPAAHSLSPIFHPFPFSSSFRPRKISSLERRHFRRPARPRPAPPP